MARFPLNIPPNEHPRYQYETRERDTRAREALEVVRLIEHEAEVSKLHGSFDLNPRELGRTTLDIFFHAIAPSIPLSVYLDVKERPDPSLFQGTPITRGLFYW